MTRIPELVVTSDGNTLGGMGNFASTELDFCSTRSH